MKYTTLSIYICLSLLLSFSSYADRNCITSDLTPPNNLPVLYPSLSSVTSLEKIPAEPATCELQPSYKLGVTSEGVQRALSPPNALPWAVLVYWGRTAENTLRQVLMFDTGGLMDETIYSVELSRRLSPDNFFRRFFQRFLFASSVELNMNLTYRDDPGTFIDEVDPYFSVRWTKFPWNRYIATGFAIGEGVSYDSNISPTEAANTSPDSKTQRFLNYLMFEITFALPNHPQWEFVGRVHHRSGVFGLYDAKNTGSSAIGVGIRYRF